MHSPSQRNALPTTPIAGGIATGGNDAPFRATDYRLSEREAADYLGLSPRTLENWRIRRSDGPRFHKLGRAVRYSIADLNAFLECTRRRSTSDQPHAGTT